MEILVFDEEYDYEKNDYLSVLTNNLKDYNIVLLQDLNESLSLYKTNNFHIVLIDFTTKSGNEFLQEVNRLNSSQKIITLGYSLSCSSEMGCDYCVDNFQKRRMIKPINSIELYKTIVEFEEIACMYKHRFKNPKVLIKDLIMRYNYFSFDEENRVIFSNKNDIHELKQLLNLIGDLKNYNINFKVLDDKCIKVL